MKNLKDTFNYVPIYCREYTIPKAEYDGHGDIIYKINGDVKGNIEINGNNIIVLLMENSDIVGNVELKGEDNKVILIKGDIRGSVKAKQVICPKNENPAKNINIPPPLPTRRSY